MRSTVLLLLATPSALAFPWLKPEGLEALLKHPEARAEIERKLQSRNAASAEPRQLVDTLKPILDPLLGLIPTSDSVKDLKRFPEGMYTVVSSHVLLTSPSGLPFPTSWPY